jgi:DnaJ-class molecular chaperone
MSSQISLSSLNQKDYYEILELPRTCSQEEISEAYRTLSLKYHPKITTPENSALYEYYFQKLGEAYEVLSDPKKKEIFDIYGKEGLKNGIMKNGKQIEGYRYLGNGHEIFEKFMGTANPFTLIRENEKRSKEIKEKENIVIDAAKQNNSNEDKNEDNIKKAKDIIIDLECTLEELYIGCTKNVKYIRKKVASDSVSLEEVEENIDVEVLRGYDKNSVVVFKGMGNEGLGEKNSDLIVKIKEKKNNLFKRVNKNDLIYIHEITLAQALNGDPVRLTTLDNRKIAISIDEIISPSTVKKVPGEGMPIYKKEPSVRDLEIEKGDLYIKFHIIFPEYIDPARKMEISQLLDNE